MFGKTKQKVNKPLTKVKKSVKLSDQEHLQQEKINLENCGKEISEVLTKYGYGLSVEQSVVLRKIMK